jgi:hypothetical protein
MTRRLVVGFLGTATLASLSACGGRSARAEDDVTDAGALDALGPGEMSDAGGFASDARPSSTSCKQTPGSIAEFLLTIASKPFPTKPNLTRVSIEILDGGLMMWTAQHVDYTRTRLVGAPVVAGPYRLQADGFFRTDPLVLDIPGEADCALPDTALMVQLTFEGGAICDDTAFACGVVNGTVLALGVDLNGSTFTAQRIKGGVIPEPVLNCERIGRVENCK